MATYKVGGRSVRADPLKSVGKGGEADIFDIGDGMVLKIYKLPDHPDLELEPLEQEAARRRIQERQRKLPAFPTNFPSHVIVPHELAVDPKSGLIAGFTMRYLKGAEVIVKLRDFDFRSTVPGDAVVQIFRDMHQTVLQLHQRDVIIGDFNDGNVMVLGKEAYLIDADSFQFGPYVCAAYTQRFVDPLLCDPNAKQLMLVKPHTRNSDWYAYAVMLMQSLLRVDPYGGVYQPKQKGAGVPFNARPLYRLSVFHPDVGYPKNAMSWGVLPDDMLDMFVAIFTKDHRGELPLRVLDAVRWTKCTSCGAEHARHVCPNCSVAVKAVVERVRGTVTARRYALVAGDIVYADYQDGKMRYLYYHDGVYKRETGEVITQAQLDPRMRFRIMGGDTLIGFESIVRHFSSTHPHVPIQHYRVDSYGTMPMFDTHGSKMFMAQAGRLLRNELAGPEFIGNTMENQTMFWVGRKLGFGFYRAGELSRAFVFNPHQRGINDTVAIPRIRGQLIDSTAFLSDTLCWFFTTTREKRQVINRCVMIDAAGNVIATSEAEDGDGSWLGTLRGKHALGSFLLTATDAGIVRVEVDGKNLSVTKEFPDTKGFVHSGNHIIPGDGGIYAIGRNEIVHITIA